MGKLVLTMCAVLISFNAIAATNVSHKLNSAIHSAIQNPNPTAIDSSYSLIYGGQDISRSLIATADESVWAGQRILVG